MLFISLHQAGNYPVASGVLTGPCPALLRESLGRRCCHTQHATGPCWHLLAWFLMRESFIKIHSLEI